jgi:hypothetical protein
LNERDARAIADTLRSNYLHCGSTSHPTQKLRGRDLRSLTGESVNQHEHRETGTAPSQSSPPRASFARARLPFDVRTFSRKMRGMQH